jgi:hypothetical protein
VSTFAVSLEVVRTRTGFGRLLVGVQALAGVDREATEAPLGPGVSGSAIFVAIT